MRNTLKPIRCVGIKHSKLKIKGCVDIKINIQSCPTTRQTDYRYCSLTKLPTSTISLKNQLKNLIFMPTGYQSSEWPENALSWAPPVLISCKVCFGQNRAFDVKC